MPIQVKFAPAAWGRCPPRVLPAYFYSDKHAVSTLPPVPLRITPRAINMPLGLYVGRTPRRAEAYRARVFTSALEPFHAETKHRTPKKQNHACAHDTSISQLCRQRDCAWAVVWRVHTPPRMYTSLRGMLSDDLSDRQSKSDPRDFPESDFAFETPAPNPPIAQGEFHVILISISQFV